ncbi:hypothetical protein ACLI4Z_18875 [Natrialbaceae archaeon A-arb3/5]
MNGHHEEKVVKVTYNEARAKKDDLTPDDVEDILPDTLSGAVGSNEYDFEETIEEIPTVIETDNITPHGCDNPNHECEDDPSREHYDDYYGLDNRIAPGSGISREDRTQPATSAFRVYSFDEGEYYLCMAGHSTMDPDERNADTESSDIIGRPVFQPNDPFSAGEVNDVQYFELGDNDYINYVDVATVEITRSDHDMPDYRLADGDGGYDELMPGAASIDLIEDLEEDGSKVCRQGTRTGRCESEIIGFDTSLSEQAYFETSDDKADRGDSGGPYFVENPEQSGQKLALGIHYGGDDIGIGYAAPAVEELLDVTVT